MNHIPTSIVSRLSSHVRDMKEGKVYGRRHSDPKSYSLSKYLRDVYAGYSSVHNLISYENYIRLLIDEGCLDASHASLVYEDMDYCPQPLSDYAEMY